MTNCFYNCAGFLNSLPCVRATAHVGEVALTWASQSGRTYTVEYSHQLTAGSWQPLANVTATGPSASYHDTTAASVPRRFYRIATQFP